jgi:YggT family protein
MYIITQLFAVADLLLRVAMYVIIAQAILSWLLAFNVLNTTSHAVRSIALGLDRLTSPLYRPIRALLPDFGGIDFSPMVVLLLIQIARMLLDGVGKQIAYSA